MAWSPGNAFIPEGLMQSDSSAFDSAKETFVRLCPDGFRDSRYLALERDYKVAAHDRWTQLIGNGTLERLIQEEKGSDLGRRLREVLGDLNLLFTTEQITLTEILADSQQALSFAKGLSQFLSGNENLGFRVDRFAGSLARLPTRGTAVEKWTIATVFPYIARPTDHMFLKPAVTQLVAERFGFTLNYRPEVNGITYGCLLQFARELLDGLQELGALDFIDAQSFIWMTGDEEYPIRAAAWLRARGLW